MKNASLILLIVLWGCSKNKGVISNLNGDRIDIFGHAGSGISSLYPTNSFESIQNAFSIGADGSEIDIQLTKDSVLVLFHNEVLDNNTNLSGRIRSMNWDQIEAGLYNVTPYTNYRICRLTTLLEQIESPGLNFTFDIKLFPSETDLYTDYINCFANAVVKIFNDYDLHSTCFLESQDVLFLQTIRSKDTSIRTFIYPQEFSTGFQIAQDLDLFGITISTKNISKEEVEIAHNQNFWVTIWDVHSKKENREAVLKNPDMIQTDNLDYLIKYLDK